MTDGMRLYLGSLSISELCEKAVHLATHAPLRALRTPTVQTITQLMDATYQVTSRGTRPHDGDEHGEGVPCHCAAPLCFHPLALPMARISCTS